MKPPFLCISPDGDFEIWTLWMQLSSYKWKIRCITGITFTALNPENCGREILEEWRE